MSTEARDRMMVEFANTHHGDPAVQRAAFNYGWGAGWDARGQGAKTINEFHGDDVWRDEEGVIWVRLSELKRAVDFATHRQVTPDREELERVIADAIDTGIGKPRNDSYTYWRKEAVAVADAILALLKGGR